MLDCPTLFYSVQGFVREACKAEGLCTCPQKSSSSSSWSSLMLKNVSVSIKSNQIGLTLKFLHLSLFPIAIRLYHKKHNIRQSLSICTHNMLRSSWIPDALNYNLSWIWTQSHLRVWLVEDVTISVTYLECFNPASQRAANGTSERSERGRSALFKNSLFFSGKFLDC